MCMDPALSQLSVDAKHVAREIARLADVVLQAMLAHAIFWVDSVGIGYASTSHTHAHTWRMHTHSTHAWVLCYEAYSDACAA